MKGHFSYLKCFKIQHLGKYSIVLTRICLPLNKKSCLGYNFNLLEGHTTNSLECKFIHHRGPFYLLLMHYMFAISKFVVIK